MKGKTADKAVGRTKSGLNSKLYTISDILGSVDFLSTVRNGNGSVHAVKLLKRDEINDSIALADWAYDAKTILIYISES